MSLKFEKDLFIKFIAAIIISISIIILSLDYGMWSSFWSFLKIPPNYIPFSDFKAHVYFLECFQQNIDVHKEECYLINDGNVKISSHPKIWIYLFKFLNLKEIYFFRISIFVLLFFYFFFIFHYLKRFKSKLHKAYFFLLFFSTTNFILIERLSTDILIFLISYLILIFNKKSLQIILIYLGFFLKYFPIFLCSIFIKNKRILFGFISSFILLLFFFYYKNFDSINNNIVEMALPIAYGSRTMLKAFYHLSEEYGLFLNEKNLFFFRYLIIIFFLFYSAFLIFLGYKNSKKMNLVSSFNRDFIIGASIFLGTYIIGSNADYRLIFLFFTIPLILELKNKIVQNILIISIFLSFNSFYFLIGEKISITFFMSASFIFLLKFIIFSLISIIMGSQLKSVNFFRLNNV